MTCCMLSVCVLHFVINKHLLFSSDFSSKIASCSEFSHGKLYEKTETHKHLVRLALLSKAFYFYSRRFIHLNKIATGKVYRSYEAKLFSFLFFALT